MAFVQTTPPLPPANLWREVDNHAPGSYDGWKGTILVMYLHFRAYARDTFKNIGRKLTRVIKNLKGMVGKLGGFIKGMVGKVKRIVGKVKDLFRKVEGDVWVEEIDGMEEGI